MKRRDLLKAAAAATFTAGVAPRLGRGADRAKTLAFVGVADLSILDPVVAGARPTRNAACVPISRPASPRSARSVQSISTEVALYNKKDEYDDILTKAQPLGNDGKEVPAQVVVFGPVIPKGAKNVQLAKEFIEYMREPKVLNQYLKGGLGRWMLPVPESAKSDPFWFEQDPHRMAHGRQTLLGPTMPIYEVNNPAVAQVGAEHVFSVAEADVMINGMAPEQAVEKAFKRAEEIFAKYPIAQS